MSNGGALGIHFSSYFQLSLTIPPQRFEHLLEKISKPPWSLNNSWPGWSPFLMIMKFSVKFCFQKLLTSAESCEAFPKLETILFLEGTHIKFVFYPLLYLFDSTTACDNFLHIILSNPRTWVLSNQFWILIKNHSNAGGNKKIMWSFFGCLISLCPRSKKK